MKSRDSCTKLRPRVLSPKQNSNKGSIFDALTYSLSHLIKVKNSENERFFKMDFTYCSQVVLNKFSPVTIEDKYSKIPPSFRSLPSEIRNFQLRTDKKKTEIRF
mmetsp:Transcript_856/g.1321  ORF Transcript_856/g.1321 Transcript_856/m.1321 type:complete len:104 (-) Transcript_856:1-312(-)